MAVLRAPLDPREESDKVTQTENIGKYLGVNNIVFWKGPINFAELIQKIQKKLAGLKANTLSRGVRLALLKSNISGMPNHILSYFKCPSRSTKKIDSESRNFFWGNSHPPVAWKTVCTPKHCGGLGVRCSTAFNRAVLAKLAWKILTEPTNLWVRIVTRKYLRKCSFFHAKKKASGSGAWNGILDARDIILQGLRWIVGDDTQINFQLYNWCCHFPLIHFVPQALRSTIDLDLTVNYFIVNGTWNLFNVQNVLPQVLRTITDTPLPLFPCEDKFVWGLIGNGMISIKSASHIQLASESSHAYSSLPTLMWKLNIPPKVKNFSWMLILLSLVNLLTIFSKIVPLQEISGQTLLYEWTCSSGRIFLLSGWIIGQISNSAQVNFQAASICSNYQRANPKSQQFHRPSKQIKWIPPTSPDLKLNFDGSVINPRLASVGAIGKSRYFSC